MMREPFFLLDEEKKSNIYNEMFRGVPDAVFVLSGGVKRVAQAAGELEYISTDYSDSDPYGMLAGKVRVDAAAEVSRYFRATKIVTTTHSPSQGTPSSAIVIHAYVLAHELKRLGVSEERILLEAKSTNTLTEIQEMAKLIAQHKWQRIGIITFELHVPRTAEMLEHLEELSGALDEELKESLAYIEKEKPLVAIVNAEAILWNVSSHYRQLIEHARTTPSYQKRLVSERNGIEAIRSRLYQPTGETWKIRSERRLATKKESKGKIPFHNHT